MLVVWETFITARNELVSILLHGVWWGKKDNMIPGSVSKMSEMTIASADKVTAKADILNLTGAVPVNTIVPGLGTAVSQFLVLNPVSGALTLGTAGNIAVGVTLVQNRPSILVWSKAAQKWLIESGV